jgi:hypothetical protein
VRDLVNAGVVARGAAGAIAAGADAIADAP